MAGLTDVTASWLCLTWISYRKELFEFENCYYILYTGYKLIILIQYTVFFFGQTVPIKILNIADKKKTKKKTTNSYAKNYIVHEYQQLYQQ